MIGVLPDVERADQRTARSTTGPRCCSTPTDWSSGAASTSTRGSRGCATPAPRHAHLPVEKFLDAVLRDLVDADLDDDIAVMAVRFTPTD